MKKSDKSKEVVEENAIGEMIKSAPIDLNDINTMPLNCLEDYVKYNIEARKLNKKLRIRRYEIKPCPIELHPKEKIVFNRNDQPNNPLPVYLSNDMIDFKEMLYPGKTYELPRCVIEYLAKKGTPHWKWFTKADGTKETGIESYAPRFALRTIYED
jgi:hypothetical protein